MSIPLRRWLPWTLLLAFVAGSWIGWIVLRRTVVEWMTADHRVGDWTVRAFGGQILSVETVRADSILVRGPGLLVVVRDVRLAWFRNGFPPVHRFPFLLDLSVRHLGLELVPVRATPPSGKPPAFPSTLRLPVALRVRVDSFSLRRDTALDVRLRGIDLATNGPSAIRGGWSDVRYGRLPVRSSGTLELDWGLDSLRGGLRSLVASGCCAHDSAALSFAAPFRDLTTGRAAFRADVRSLHAWSELAPGLLKAPQLSDIRLELAASRRSGSKPSGELRLGFSADTVLFAPRLRWDVLATTDSVGTRLRVGAVGAKGAKLAVDLAASGDLEAALRADRFAGKASVRGLGYFLADQPHPFDGDIEVKSIGLQGGTGTVRLASGSVVEGGATWKGLHWHCNGVVAGREPWALAWVPGIGLGEGSRIEGHDTTGAALFHVLAVGPKYHQIAADSMEVRARLDVHRIAFPSIRLWSGARSWRGDGDVDWTAKDYAFALSPDSGLGRATVEGDFLGEVRADLQDFPTEGLPIADPRAKLPYPVSVTAHFQRLPPAGRDPASMLLSAVLRAKPAAESLEIRFDASQHGRTAEVSGLRAALGSAVVEGGAQATEDSLGWHLVGVRSSFTDLELERIGVVWPGLPPLKGRVEGALSMSRAEGVKADARLEGISFKTDAGWTILPNLVLWGERDTMNLAGHWPVGGFEDPFRLTVEGLFERNMAFQFLAFHGDIVRLKAEGRLDDRSRLSATFRAEGGIAIPGTEARFDRILVDGKAEGKRTTEGITWSASMEGKDGVLRALKGLPLRSRFLVRAEPGTIHLDSLTLRGQDAGEIDFHGQYGLASHLFVGEGKARDFHLDLGDGKKFRLGSMDLVAGADERLRAKLSDVSWEQNWGSKGGLWVDVDHAQLTLVQAKDWRKLQGQIEVRKLLYTREIADPKSLILSAGSSLSGSHRRSVAGDIQKESLPLLLDLRIWGGGDSVRVANNLAQASLTFDLQATGPSDALLLNGTVDADPEGASFGYLGKKFKLEEAHSEWNSAPPLNGKYSLEGSRAILQSCPEALASKDRTTNLSTTTTETCNLKLSSAGTLGDPRLQSFRSDCGAGGADEGAMQTTIALARDCYPEDAGAGNTTLGTTAGTALVDFGVQTGVGYVNDAIRRQLTEQRQEGRVFLPDSVALTDVPIGGTSGQLGLLALYRLSDHVDAEGEYRHTFAQTATTTNAVATLADDYSLRLRWRPPMAWVEDRHVQDRLRDHLVFQVELGQTLDDRSQRETTIRPSIRYRWEFW